MNYIVGGKCKMLSHYVKLHGGSPKKPKNRTVIWSSNPNSGNVSKRIYVGSWRDICAPVFIFTLFTVAKRWKKPKCSSVD